jgi:enoyl-CoA hydratase/carnithine racemase
MEVASRGMQDTFGAIANIGKPVVAAITGYALGGGLELALCADFRVCGQSSRLGLPEILLGIIPGGGGTQRLPRLIGPARAKNLIFTGRFVDAQEALRIGLIDEVADGDDAYDAATRLAGRLCAGPPLALRSAKQTIDAGLELDLDAGLEIERQRFSALFGTEDQRLGMSSFIQQGPGKAHFVGR